MNATAALTVLNNCFASYYYRSDPIRSVSLFFCFVFFLSCPASMKCRSSQFFSRPSRILFSCCFCLFVFCFALLFFFYYHRPVSSHKSQRVSYFDCIQTKKNDEIHSMYKLKNTINKIIFFPSFHRSSA